MKNSKMKKRNRGITLIALVVTIVVTIIIASITLGTLLDKNGIIKKSQSSKENAESQGERIAVEQATTSAMTQDEYGKVKEDILKQELDNTTEDTGSTETYDDIFSVLVTFDETDRTYEVDVETGEVTPIPYPYENNGLSFSYALQKDGREWKNDGSEWTNDNVVVTVEFDEDDSAYDGWDEDKKIMYRLEEDTDWKEYDETDKIVSDKSQKVYAKVQGDENRTKVFEGEVKYVDKIKPIVREAEVIDHDIRIKATDEASGIVGYAITGTKVEPSRFTSVQNTLEFEDVVTPTTRYSKNYIWVIDAAGNVGNSDENVEMQLAPDGASIIIAHTPTEWTNGNVIATAKTNVDLVEEEFDISQYQIQMSTDGEHWTTTTTLEVTENGTVYARYWDGEYGGNPTTHPVTNIDKIRPVIKVSSSSATTVSKTKLVTISASDEGGSGLSNDNAYEYYVSSSKDETIGGSWEKYANGEPETIGEGLTGTYYIHVKKVRDVAGNISQGEGEVEGQDDGENEIFGPFEFSNEPPIITIDPNEHLEYTKTAEVTITAKDQNGTGLSKDNTYEYYLSTSKTEQKDGEWKPYQNEEKFTIGEGLTGTYYIHVKPVSDNIGNTSDAKVSGEFHFDNEPPTLAVTPESTSAAKKTNVKITAKDKGGAGLKEESDNFQYYLSTSETELKDGEWKPYTNGQEVTIGEELNGTYYLHIKEVSDKAGNTGEAKVTGPYVFVNIDPVITIEPNGNNDYPKIVEVTITATDKSGTGLSPNNTYEYYLSTSQTEQKDGEWKPYTNGQKFQIGEGLTGTYYIHVKPVSDNIGNISKEKISEAFHFDNMAPTIKIDPESKERYTKTADVTISIEDTGGSGISSTNTYEYYLSTSSTEQNGGEWKTYSPGEAFTIGEGLTGTYYIHVKGVSDNAGNTCDTKVSGKYNFDNIAPTVDVKPENSGVAKTVNVTVTATDTGGAGLDDDSGNYQYYLSTSETEQIDGTWKRYTNGEEFEIGEGLNGTFYLHIKEVSDNAGNVGEAKVTGPYEFVNVDPVIIIDPEENYDYPKSIEVTITAQDKSGSGLSSSNVYEYYLSTSQTEQIGNSSGWQPYVSGQPFTIGEGLTGTYYIHVRAVSDNLGNTSGPKVSGEFHFDNTAPTISINPNSQSNYTKTKNVTITVIDTGGSGLSDTNTYEYYLSTSRTTQSGGEWKTYTRGQSFIIGENLTGTYYIHVKGVSDNAGNTSTTKVSGAFNFDNTAPTINVSPESSPLSKTLPITINATDVGGAGLSSSNSYQYYLSTSQSEQQGGNWQNYSNGNSFEIGEGLNGTYYLHVRGVSDNAGNSCGNKVTGPYTFANVEPVITINPNSQSNYTKTTQVTITAEDRSGAGLSSSNIYEYYLSTSQYTTVNGYWDSYTNGRPETIGEGLTGTYYIHVKSVRDNLGNESGEKVSGAFHFDNTAPTITISPNNQSSYTQSTSVRITVQDTGYSGLSRSNIYEYYLSTSQYSQTGGDGWHGYSSGHSFTIGTGLTGTYYIHVRGVSDNAGNSCANKVSGAFRFDNTDPTISVSPTSSSAAKSVNVTIRASDSHSGLSSSNSYQYYLSTSQYSQTGGDGWHRYSNDGYSIKIGEGLDGTYYLHVRGVSDNAGNSCANKVTGPYVFANTPPTITITPNSQSSYTKSTYVKINVRDNSGTGLSSSNSYQYYVSTSSSYNSYGDWKNYTPGNSIKIGEGLTGTYYIHVKPVYDNAGNSSGSETSGAFHFDNTAPTIVIDPNYNYNWTQSTNVTITVQDSGGSGLSSSNSYQYYLSTSSTTTTGGDGWHTYSRGRSFSIGSDLTGIYYLHVRGVSDNAGNSCANKVSGAFYFDNTDPTISVTPPSSSTPSRSVSVTIRASDSNSGLSTSNRYQYCLSTSRTSANGSWTSYTNGNLTTIGAGLNGTYYLHVRGVSDKVGNSCSNYVTGPYTFANEAPTITITPDGNPWSKSTNVTIDVTDNSGTGLSSSNRYEYYLSTSSAYTTGGTWKTYSRGRSFTIGAGLNGTYYIHVRGVSDNTGNKCDNKVSGAFQFDNIKPTISFNPNGGSSVSSVKVTISDNLSGLESNSFRYYISSSAYTPAGSRWRTGYLTNGSATISLSGQSGTKYIYIDTVSDNAGNTNDAVSDAFQFDSTRPTITISPNRKTWSKSTSVTITVQDSGGSGLSDSNDYEYCLTTSSSYPTSSWGVSWKPYTSGRAFTIGEGLTGTYYIHVKAVEDNAGNSSGNKNSGAFQFDNTAPVISVSPTSQSTAVSSTRVKITATDTGSGLANGTSYQYYLSTSSTRLSGGSWTTYSSGAPKTIGEGLNGTYYLFVKQVSDKCSNTSTTKGTLTTISRTKYHRFGPYKFENANKGIYVALKGTTLGFFDNDLDAKEYADSTSHYYGNIEGDNYTSDSQRPWNGVRTTVKKAQIFDKIQPTSTARWFSTLSNMTTITSLTNLDTSKVTSMKDMFADCNSLTSVSVSHFDTSNVTNMMGMFARCSSLTSIDVSDFNTSKVTTMNAMFQGCSKITSLDLRNWNTSKVTDFTWLFRDCTNLSNIQGINNLNTRSVTALTATFANSPKLTSLDLSNWSTSRVTDMQSIFSGCSGLTSLNLFTNVSSVKKMNNAFENCSSLTLLHLATWDTSKATDMSRLFSGCLKLSTISGVKNFKTSNVTNMDHMFAYCQSITSLDLSSWDTSRVTSMESMINNCIKLSSISVFKTTTNVTNMQNIFEDCTSLTSLNLTSWNTKKATKMKQMFMACSKLTKITVGSGWSTSQADTKQMFTGCGTQSVTKQ